MKQILLSFIFLSFISCIKQKKNDANIKTASKTEITSENKASKTEKTVLDTTKKIDLGYADKYEKLPRLAVDTITETEFNQLKSFASLEKVKTEKMAIFSIFKLNIQNTNLKNTKITAEKKAGAAMIY